MVALVTQGPERDQVPDCTPRLDPTMAAQAPPMAEGETWFAVWFRTDARRRVPAGVRGTIRNTHHRSLGGAELYARGEGRVLKFGAYVLYRATSREALERGEYTLKTGLTAIP